MSDSSFCVGLRLIAIVVVGMLSVGCRDSRLRECEQLTTAIAKGSSTAMLKSDTLEGFKAALTAAADDVAKVPDPPPQRGAASAIDLGTPRDAYVKVLRAAAAGATTAGHSPARSALVDATGKAIDAINLRCSGER